MTVTYHDNTCDQCGSTVANVSGYRITHQLWHDQITALKAVVDSMIEVLDGGKPRTR